MTMQDVADYIIYLFKDELSRYNNCKLRRRQRYNKAENCIAIQCYYNKEYDTLYIYYELDKYLKSIDEYKEAMTRLNTRILNNLTRELPGNHKVEVVSPHNRKLNIFNTRNSITQKPYIDQTTFTYWYCMYSDTYQFLSGTPGINHCESYNHPEDFYIGEDNPSRLKREAYLKEIASLNKEFKLMEGYNNLDEDTISKAFEKFNEINLKYYNKTYTSIKIEDIVTIYLDTIYE